MPAMRGWATSGDTAMTAGSGTSTVSTSVASMRLQMTLPSAGSTAMTSERYGTSSLAASWTPVCLAYRSAEPSPQMIRSKPPAFSTSLASSAAVANASRSALRPT